MKAFIHDRKPQSLGRKGRKAQNVQIVQDVQFSSEDDSVATLQFQSSLAIGHDANAQESSSQSSSADNGEPQTPSPQYSTSRVQHSSSNASPNRILEGVSDQPINLDDVDPQLARLLSSLSMSASGPHSVETDKTNSVSVSHQPSQASDAPQPFLEVAPVPPPSQDDWSSRAPGPLATLSPPIMRPPMQSQPDQSLLSVSTSYLQSSPSDPSHTTLHSASRLDVPTSSRLPAHASLSSHLPQLSSPSATSPRAHARRSSAAADISPYLSRARNVPTGKEMRYISMLENVAKESDRAASSPRQPGQSLQSGFMSFGDRLPMAPAPPASVPPMMMSAHGPRMDQPLIYSSPAAAPPLGPQMRPPTAFNIPPTHLPGDDPFTVRPHTSNHFHAIPPSQASSGMFVDPSRRGVPVNTGIHPMGVRQPAFGPPPLSGQYNPAAPRAMQMAIPPRDAQTAFRVNPHQLPPPPINPGPLLASTSPMTTLLARNNASRAANNAQLLSILNTPNTASRVGPIMAAPNVLGGIGPR